MAERDESSGPARFHLHAIAAEFPDTAETMLLDRYLSDREHASARLFRVYRPVPAHFHRNCDEHLLVLSGPGIFWMGSEQESGSFAPGDLLIFARGTLHAIAELGSEPVVFFALDTPRRDPRDVIFLHAEDGTAESFIRQAGGTQRSPD